MNLSPVIASSAPPPADAPRNGEPAHAEEFSNVLSQQRGRVRERDAAMAPASPKSTRSAAIAEDDAPAPDETLELLAAGAILPLMMSRAEPAGERGASPHGAGMDGATPARTAPGAANPAHAIPAGSQAAVSIPGAAPRNPADSLQADERQTPAALVRTTEPGTSHASNARSSKASLAHAHAALASRTDTATGPAQADARLGSKPDAAQAAFARIASSVGLNTQAMAIRAAHALDGHALHDTGHAMAGAVQAPGAGAMLPTGPSGPSAVTTPVSSPAWAADFSRQFVSMAQGRDSSQPHTIELRLDPPSLGPVRITLHISDSIAQAAFVSPHAVVRQAIENALPQLQQHLADAGLSLGQASVNDQQAGQQGFEQNASQSSRSAAVFSLDGHSAPDASALPPVPRQAPRSPDALVDTFA